MVFSSKSKDLTTFLKKYKWFNFKNIKNIKKWFSITAKVRWRKPKMMIDTGSDHRWQGRAMSIPLQRCIDCIHFRYTSTIDNSSIIQTLILISLCSYPVCEQEALLTYIQHNYMQHMKPIRHERLLESRQFHGLDMLTPYRRKYSFSGYIKWTKYFEHSFPIIFQRDQVRNLL